MTTERTKINYKPLWKMLIDRDISKQQLREKTSIARSTMVKMSNNEYYVNMMKAWFFATALAKQYEATLPYIKEKRLDNWSHNKAIQKSIESFRVPKEHKEELKRYKIK